MLDIIILVMCGGLATTGLVLIVDYLYARFAGKITDHEIIEFSDKKYWGRPLPRIHISRDKETFRDIQIHAIDHIGYLISPPTVRQIIPILMLPNGKARVYGYLRLVAGTVLSIPLFLILALQSGRTEVFNQAFYGVVLMGIILLGWIILRRIARSN